jgi:serine/threonine protein phosphatase PrpC
MNLRVADHAQVSDTGRQRTANEDSFFASAPIFAVADGMGGAQAGEVASRIAAESFEPVERGDSSPEAYLRSIAEGANARINSLAKRDSAHSGMGTTFTAALVEGDEVSLAHVGDSRAYRFRDGELRLLTSDHSLVEELRRQGRLTDEQAEDHPQRSIITRALGPESSVEVDTMTYRAQPGDVYLLCSDGLTTMVKEDTLASVLATTPDLSAAAAKLIDAANAAGGRDNITVVAFRLEEAAEGAEPTEQATLIGPTAAEAGLGGDAVRDRAEARAAAAPARRRAPVEPPRRSRARTLVKALVGLLIVGAVVAGAILGARQIYFVGTDDAGQVALFRGLPYDLPFGIELYGEVESSPVLVSSLPEAAQQTATEHELRGRDDAESLIEFLEDESVQAAPERERDGGATGQQNNRQQGGSGNQG